MSKTVLVPMADGTEELEAVTVIDVLRRAGASVTVASVDGMRVTASRGVMLGADEPIADSGGTTYDLIVLPGGLPGAEHLRDCAILADILKAQAAAGRMIGAICAAPIVVLKAHGLLPAEATCHSSFADQLESAAGAEEAVVVSGTVVTSRGPLTAMAFALTLVELLYGEAKRRTVEGAMA